MLAVSFARGDLTSLHWIWCERHVVYGRFASLFMNTDICWTVVHIEWTLYLFNKNVLAADTIFVSYLCDFLFCVYDARHSDTNCRWTWKCSLSWSWWSFGCIKVQKLSHRLHSKQRLVSSPFLCCEDSYFNRCGRVSPLQQIPQQNASERVRGGCVDAVDKAFLRRRINQHINDMSWHMNLRQAADWSVLVV